MPPQPIQTYAGDPGLPGDPASWRTPEFVRDVGLVSLGAEFAYAAGYSGTFDQSGAAKWSCVTAPSNNINCTTVHVVSGVPQPRYGSASGTSMAGPHSAAALALIMQRFAYMTNEQAL